MADNTPDNAAATQPPKNGNGRRKRILTILALGFVVVGMIYGAYWWLAGQYYQDTDDAYVMGNLVTVTPQVTATVTSIDADETDLVRQGQPLVRLDDTNSAIALDQAKANLAETVRQVKQTYEHVGQLREQVSLRQADVARAKQDLARRQALIAEQAVSREELQHNRTAYNNALAALRAAEHDLQAENALVQGTDVEHHPRVQAAEAKLRAAYVEWQRRVVPAPVSGYVAKRSVQIGQRVSPGTPLMTIVPLDQVWVEANFKEDQFANIRIGQPVTMVADLYGKAISFHGKIVGVGAGTGAAFALLPPQNASGNWIKIVQRVPVRISLDAKEISTRPLRVGLSMQVSVDTHQRNGDILARQPVSGARYSTPVYNTESGDVNALIGDIVSTNLAKVSGLVARH
ncbi:MAG: HlyD family efflux transporter periplasmic adaptor subunit [Gammaproteobacteria bacterium]|nr:HlyD family efflux transporter periplasmic adaptor subunit [Gammaproteobacteria bacterium]